MMNKFEGKAKNLIIMLIFLFCILLFSSFAIADSMLEKGFIVNAKMKTLAAGTVVDAWTDTSDIKAIRMADSLPEDFIPSDVNTVSVAGSDFPVYIFYNNEKTEGIIYFYIENGKIIMNPDSSYMFADNLALVDISALANWDSSKVISLDGAFMFDPSLSDLSPLSDWDVHNVTGLIQTFMYDTSLCNISALANWDTSNVSNMLGLFDGAKSLPDALALRNWDTSNVTDMSYMFSKAISLTYIDVSNWNTSKVTSMKSMFQVGDNYKGNGQLKDIIGLGNLDVSNVTDMTCMFYGAGQMTYYDISNWNVSKVESMNHMFGDNFSLRTLDLSRWDVSYVKTMYCMFDDNINLKTIGDVSHWNTTSLIDVGGWINGATSFVGDNYGTMDLSGWNTSNLKTAAEMFRGAQIRIIDLSGWTFDSITNDLWDGANKGIFYETGNTLDSCKGLGDMFKSTPNLKAVYVSQSGLDSYNAVVEKGISIVNMWAASAINGFTVKK